MMLVPESDEVVRESLDSLVEAVDLAVVIQDITLAEDILRPLFLQGGPFLIQHLVVILGTIFSYLEVLEWEVSSFCFADLWKEESDAPILMDDFYWRGDDIASVVDMFIDCFRNHDVLGFKNGVANSYFMGFSFFAGWFIPLVATMAVIGDLGVNILEEREDEDGTSETA